MKESNNEESKLIIWGASGHAKVVADIVRLEGKYEIEGFLDDINPESRMKEFCNVHILGGREQLEVLYNSGVRHLLFGFGNCRARLELAKFILAKGFTLPTAIHPKSIIARDVSIGAGTVIVAGVVVNSGTTISNNVILNTCSSIDHDCFIADGVHISPGAHLAGNVHVGQGTWIGIGTAIKEGVNIGINTIIGTGSVVLRDIPNNVVAYGSPAQIIRSNT
ncbi:MAG: sugar acetyltransferase [Thiotrichaceae bacterium IS1]|nr:MAG: sugar acetyltransferase [Thiotrichaceae bacterium IS1]